MTVRCRPAVRDDLDAIAEVRIRSWQAAYRGLIPQAYLDALSPAEEAERRRPRFGSPTAPMTDHVAEVDGAVVGWAALGPYRDGDPPAPGCGEVGAIYLLPAWWGRGVGRELMAYCLGELRRRGLAPVLLWVATGNARARRFYERVGFRADGASHDFEVGGAVVAELRYRHDGVVPPGSA